jgi:catechol 2,3-dioxygenase-like lactoylglutathione lyase family enzyme
MIGYTTLGTNDIARASAFYDALFAELGAKRLWNSPKMVGWGRSMKEPTFVVCQPHNGEAATAGNGTMIAVAVKDPAQAETLHAKALSLGATDEGAPGMRGKTFYCAYVRDADGNKLNFFCLV